MAEKGTYQAGWQHKEQLISKLSLGCDYTIQIEIICKLRKEKTP